MGLIGSYELLAVDHILSTSSMRDYLAAHPNSNSGPDLRAIASGIDSALAGISDRAFWIEAATERGNKTGILTFDEFRVSRIELVEGSVKSRLHVAATVTALAMSGVAGYPSFKEGLSEMLDDLRQIIEAASMVDISFPEAPEQPNNGQPAEVMDGLPPRKPLAEQLEEDGSGEISKPIQLRSNKLTLSVRASGPPVKRGLNGAIVED